LLRGELAAGERLTQGGCPFSCALQRLAPNESWWLSSAAARAEFGDELSNSRSHDDENSAQKTVLISGIGDGAFYSADGPAIGLTGFRASYVISIGSGKSHDTSPLLDAA
jgi:hypothetical protein